MNASTFRTSPKASVAARAAEPHAVGLERTFGLAYDACVMRAVALSELERAVDLSADLERGEIVSFPQSPLPLPPAQDVEFLRTEMPSRLKRKNVSWYPERGLKGIADPIIAARTEAILAARSQAVQLLLQRIIPSLAQGWTVGTSSFRPFEEKGRNLSAHASNELIHVDAGAYGATHGDRILRFFTNLNPSADRVWVTKGSFTQLYNDYAAAAGIAGPHHLAPNPWDRVRSGFLGTLKSIAPGAAMIDSSPYDRVMRRFHNFMKDTPAFQQDPKGFETLRFPPSSSWMCLTDTVSHACIEGQHALVDTFVIPLRNCRVPEVAPFHVLSAAR